MEGTAADRERWLVGYRYGLAMALGAVAMCRGEITGTNEVASALIGCLDRLTERLRHLRINPPAAGVPDSDDTSP